MLKGCHAHKKNCQCMACVIRYGKDHPNWKGDNVGYAGIHKWIKTQIGKPKKCEDCRSTTAKKYEWANISGKYKRSVDDWKRLCVKCHRRFDKHLTPKGIDRAHTKLNEKKVKKIRFMYKSGKYSQDKLAEIFQVTQNTIWQTIRRIRWKHID